MIGRKADLNRKRIGRKAFQVRGNRRIVDVIGIQHKRVLTHRGCQSEIDRRLINIFNADRKHLLRRDAAYASGFNNYFIGILRFAIQCDAIFQFQLSVNDLERGGRIADYCKIRHSRARISVSCRQNANNRARRIFVDRRQIK